MQRSGVRLSVRLSVHCSLATFASLLLCARWAGDIDRLQHDGCSAPRRHSAKLSKWIDFILVSKI